MTKAEDFKNKMSELTDEELYEMIAQPEDYVADAIETAKEELKTRKLSPEKISEFERERKGKEQEMATIANAPLSWPMRILMFILSFGVLQAIIGEYYRNKGYERKHRECWTWMKYGLFFFVSMLVVLYVISLVVDKYF
jgi:hypothetical protein